MTTILLSLQIILVGLQIINIIHAIKRKRELAENTRLTRSIENQLEQAKSNFYDSNTVEIVNVKNKGMK
jgi:heme exporter protein D